MQAFSGIRVIDATHVLAGPFATYQLAVLGADVIKVEHPLEFDQAREGGTDAELNSARMGTLYLAQSSNKRAITLDLKTAEGKEVFLRLIATADILVENYRPGAFDELGLGYHSLREINPKLIYCSISAFGHGGPRTTETAYDHVIQATSGLMYGTGTPEVHPLKIGPPVIDYATGTTGAFALATALFQRSRTGTGQRIDLAMADVATMMMSSQVTGYLRNGVAPRPIGNRLQHATNWAYETKDGLLMLGAANLRQQRRLWNLLGFPEMIKTSNEARDADVDGEAAVLRKVMLNRTADEWEALLQKNRIPASRVRTLQESLADPQVGFRPLLHFHQNLSAMSPPLGVPVAAFSLENGGHSIKCAPPTLGQDTDQILKELGYVEEDVAKMRRTGAI